MTKDISNMFETVDLLKEGSVKLNVVSFCGYT